MPGNDERRPLLQDDGDDKEVVQFEKDDAENPLNWTFRYKVLTTTLFSLTTLGCTFTSSVFSSAQEEVSKEFGLSDLVATLGTSLYGTSNYIQTRSSTDGMLVLAYAFGPLLFAPASEFMGRRRPLVLGYGVFALTQTIVATAKNPAMIFIGRLLGGFFSSAPLA